MKRDDIVEKVLTGIIKSQKEYLRWENVSVSQGVRAHSIWPPCALALGQLTHEYLARLRIDYVAT
ncbi:MAG: hypothetical protein KU29_12895 [Sulfurovum sp. FS06-10]|nr:MAG: hypothetical protein KU29_12895 [Sulfurovum sp. FS06-10]